MSLAQYLKSFSRLRTYKDRKKCEYPGHPFDYNFIPFKTDYDGERLIFENCSMNGVKS